jgi:hypothetical protein
LSLFLQVAYLLAEDWEPCFPREFRASIPLVTSDFLRRIGRTSNGHVEYGVTVRKWQPPRSLPVVVVVMSPRHRHVCLDVAATLWNIKRRYYERRVSAETLDLNTKWIVS